jgi:hypothetical protein
MSTEYMLSSCLDWLDNNIVCPNHVRSVHITLIRMRHPCAGGVRDDQGGAGLAAGRRAHAGRPRHLRRPRALLQHECARLTSF